jgi:hypothetical protein
MWYAQAHPAEDFAETFAVWLNPNSNWRRTYSSWPALKKLELVDSILREIASSKPIITTREPYKPLQSLRVTLREHYDHKRRLYLRDYPRLAPRDLRRIFSDVDGNASTKLAHCRRADRFIESLRPHLRETISRWTGESALTIDAALVDIQIAARGLHLHLHRPAEEAEEELLTMLATATIKFLKSPQHRVVV